MTVSQPVPRHGWTTIRGVRLHHVDWGGEGPPALLLHPTGFHARIWDPVARRLAARRRVFALDFRGHGDSDKPDGPYDWSVLVTDVVGWLEAQGLSGVLGIGHSLGATITAGAAAARPELYERLVLVDVILVPRELREAGTWDNPLVEAARKRRVDFESHDRAFETYRQKLPFSTWREEVLRLYVEHGFEPAPGGRVRLKCPPSIEAEVFQRSADFDGWAVLDRLTLPTLLVRGEHSLALSELDAARALGHLRRGRLVTAPGTTHFVPMERPEWLAEEIERFCTAAEPQPRLPLPTRGLRHLALRVRSLEEVRDFYREIFGMEVVWQPDPDNVYLSSGRDNLALHRVEGDEVSGGGALDHLGFLMERPAEVYAAAEALEQRGIRLLQQPRRHRDGSCSFYVRDPAGNVVQVLYSPDVRRE